jgi:hypothetical protein
MIHLAQILCPQRHCILAAAFDPETSAVERVIHGMFQEAKRLGLNDWCGICGSHDLSIEVARTPYPTMEEAMVEIKKVEAANITSRAALDAAGLTHDIQNIKKN